LSKSFLLLFFKKEGFFAACLTCGRLPGQLQKTFANSGWASAERPKPVEQKFFASFFKKAGLPAAGLTCGRLPGQLQKKEENC
jgi:hypothetical protein